MGELLIFISLSFASLPSTEGVFNTGLSTFGIGAGFGTSLGIGYNSIGRTTYQSGSSGGVQCPNQTEFELLSLFSADPTFYPIDLIATELTGRPDLAACLVREVVPVTAPTVPVDNVYVPRAECRDVEHGVQTLGIRGIYDFPMSLLQAIPTCPYLEIALQSFVRYGGRCYILRNFQEVVRYVNCITRRCRKCGNNHGYNFGDSPQQCVKNYQYVSVWAFCTGLPVLSQITRERVIIPTSCSCRKLRCYASSGHYGK